MIKQNLCNVVLPIPALPENNKWNSTVCNPLLYLFLLMCISKHITVNCIWTIFFYPKFFHLPNHLLAALMGFFKPSYVSSIKSICLLNFLLSSLSSVWIFFNLSSSSLPIFKLFIFICTYICLSCFHINNFPFHGTFCFYQQLYDFSNSCASLPSISFLVFNFYSKMFICVLYTLCLPITIS